MNIFKMLKRFLFGENRDTKVEEAATPPLPLFSVGVPGTEPIYLTSPLDNPLLWPRSPMFEPPKDVDIAECQREINKIFGITEDRGAGNEIIKLVWNGDRRFWFEVFMEWYGNGKPRTAPVLRPRYKYGQTTDHHGKLISDIFPPRWILLTRLEPEQYAHTWFKESYFWDPGIRAWKQVRPENPPPVYWLSYAIIANHRDGCCADAKKRKRRCFGEYAPPEFYYEHLAEQKKAMDNEGLKRSPFEKVDLDMVSQLNDAANGYRYEMKTLQAEAEVMMANPMAMVGLQAAVASDATYAKAKQRVQDFYNKEIDQLADTMAKTRPGEHRERK